MGQYSAIIQSFFVRPSPKKGKALDACWVVEVASDSQSFTPKFQLLISETSSGPWFPVLDELTEDVSAEGIGRELQSHRQGRFLKLQVFDPAGQVVIESDPMDPTHEMSLNDYREYREQIRLENLALETHTGFCGFLAKRIITECKCDCADPILGGAPDSHCDECNGTGVVRGYHRPIPMLADWSASPKSSGNQQETTLGISEVEQRQIKILPFPAAAFKDIWIDPASDLRYVVVSPITPIVYKIFPVAQIVTISLLPKSDPAYKIKIDA